MIARQYLFSGRVQGVGFRYSTKQLAKGFDVVGTRMAADGGLEILLEKDLYPNGPPDEHSEGVEHAQDNDEAD